MVWPRISFEIIIIFEHVWSQFMLRNIPDHFDSPVFSTNFNDMHNIPYHDSMYTPSNNYRFCCMKQKRRFSLMMKMSWCRAHFSCIPIKLSNEINYFASNQISVLTITKTSWYMTFDSDTNNIYSGVKITKINAG